MVTIDCIDAVSIQCQIHGSIAQKKSWCKRYKSKKEIFFVWSHIFALCTYIYLLHINHFRGNSLSCCFFYVSAHWNGVSSRIEFWRIIFRAIVIFICPAVCRKLKLKHISSWEKFQINQLDFILWYEIQRTDYFGIHSMNMRFNHFKSIPHKSMWVNNN